MPDVFVAPEDKKENDSDNVLMHKRMPLEKKINNQTPAAEEFTLPQTPVQETAPTPTQIPSTPLPISFDYSSLTPKEDPDDEEDPMEEEKLESRNAIPLLTSFWQNPQGIYFDTQEANEHILLFLRRHFITNLTWISGSILFLLLPIVGSILLQFGHYSLTFLPGSFITAIVAIYYLIVLSSSFMHFLDWYFNISLITAKRVMDIELKDLVYKKISATKISLVQDINYQQSGTIRTIFNYGDVLIQTAGATDNFYVNAVPKPEVVVQILEELIGKGRGAGDDSPL